MSAKPDLEKPTTPTTKTERKVLAQPMLTAEEMAELRRSSQEAMAEFRAMSKQKRKLDLKGSSRKG